MAGSTGSGRSIRDRDRQAMNATTTISPATATGPWPNPIPLADLGWPKKSANDAPTGRVRMYATQKVSTGLTPSRQAASGTRMSAMNTSADAR
jgi:hypothetical protein